MAEVKCFLCSQKFDRDIIDAVKVTANRYAHKTCVTFPTEQMKEIIMQEKKKGKWIAAADEDGNYAVAQSSQERLKNETNKDLLLNTKEENIHINKDSGVISVESKEKNNDDTIKVLQDTIQSIFGSRANWVVCMKQAKSYKNKYGYTYSGMARTLIWYYEKQKNDVKYSKGTLSIIPSNYDKAYNYYRANWEKQQQNKRLIGRATNQSSQTITIVAPTRKTLQDQLRKPQFTFLDEVEE